MHLASDFEIIEAFSTNQSPIELEKMENALYHQYAYFIKEGMKKYQLDEDDSFSAYTDALLSLIQNLVAKKFDGRSAIKTYLYQIFSNKCVDLIRKKTTKKEVVHQNRVIIEHLEMLPDTAKTIVEEMISRIDQNSLQVAIHNLGEKCREILLYYEQGFSDQQIAVHTGYQNAAVAKTSRLRCIGKLKALVSPTSQ